MEEPQDPARLCLSDELREIIEEAEDIAYASGQVPSSAHLLLAFFTSKNRTESFLRARAIDEDRLLRAGPPLREPRGAVRSIMERGAQVAAGCGARLVDGLHVLVGMTRVRSSAAHELLTRAGVSLPRLRGHALALVTGAGARWEARGVDAPRLLERGRHHLSRRPLPNDRLEAGRPDAVAWTPPLLEPPKRTARRDPPPLRSPSADRSGPPADAFSAARPDAAPSGAEQASTPGRRADELEPTEPGPPPGAGATPAPYPSAAPAPSRPPTSTPEPNQRAAPPTKDKPRAPDPAPGGGRTTAAAPAGDRRTAPTPAEDRRVTRTPAPSSSPAPEAEGAAPVDPGGGWSLPEEDFPWLATLGRNLSREAARGELDVLVGREREVEQLIDVLGKRRANNPCLVGPPGVGKTAIVEGLAARWVEGGPAERERIVIGLDVGRLLVGTHLRGSLSEKLEGLKDEVRRAEGKVLIFFDELHTLIGAGASGDGPLDAAQALKTALARGDFPCIGATTPAEFDRHIARDPALQRRFVPVLVDEPSPEQAEAMLYRILPAYADHHGVGYTPDAVRAAVRLSARFLPEQHLPDKAIALLDLAGSRASRGGRDEVDPPQIANILSERTGIPAERLLTRDQDRLLGLEEELGRKVVGHRRSIARIAEVIRRHAAGFGSHRPLGSFLLVGPSGVGKTETAKALATILHGPDPGALVRFDLSEFGEAHSVARLVGAPPGYVGFESGGQLTEAVRTRPGRVILLDEIEKAHPEVLQTLLQILDDGRLTDGHGRTVSFAESILILTSNLGAEVATRRALGFGDALPAPVDVESSALEAARRALPPELWGRIDEKLYFAPLSRAEVRRIARLLALESSARLERERGIAFELDGRALDVLVEQGGTDIALGARPLRRVLGHLVEGPIAARVLEGRLHAGERVWVSRRDGGGLVFRVGEDGPSLSRRPSRLDAEREGD